MSFKYCMSFAVKDEREQKDIKTKFERYNMNGSNKEHFLEILEYFNFHRSEVADRIKLEKSVIPSFRLRFITNEATVVIEIINEKFPKTITCGSKEFDLNSSWLYKVRDFIKKYKITDDLVYLNIDKVENSVYITIEINEEGDVEMSERTKKYVISIGYKSEEDRDLSREKLKEFMGSPEEQQCVTFDRIINFANHFDKDIVKNPELMKEVSWFVRNKAVRNPKTGAFEINLKKEIQEYIDSMNPTDHNCTDEEERIAFLLEILESVDLMATTVYNYTEKDSGIITDDIMNECWVDADIRILGWNRAKSNAVFTTHGLDSSITVSNIIADAHSHLADKGINAPELRHMIEQGIHRFIMNNPVEAIKYHIGLNRKLNINVVLNKEEKECRGILGRLFNRKPKDVWLYKEDITVVVSTEFI